MEKKTKTQDPEQLPRDFKGIWIPREIWLHSELSWFEKMLWAEIDSLDCVETGCTASNLYFQSFFNREERIIQMSIARLKRLGLVAQTHFDGRKRTLRSSLKSTYEKFCAPDPKPELRGAKNCTSSAQKIAPPPTPPYKEENKEENTQEVASLCAFFSGEWEKSDPAIALKKPSKQDLADLRKLLDQWSESKIRLAMSWAINHDFWRGRVTSIKGFVKNSSTIDIQMRSKAADNATGSTIDRNMAIARDWQNKCNTGQMKGILVDLLNSGVEVSRKGDLHPDCIRYDEKDFEGMLTRAIKKRETR